MKYGRLLLAATLALAIAGGSYVAAQIRTRVDLVLVPVSVRDASGKLVTGLTREDFVVSEDGKPQTISSFDIEAQPLSAVIVVDDGMSGDKLNRLFPLGSESLLVTLTSGFSPQDEMAAYRYDHFVEKLSDFTSDPEAIQKSFGVLMNIAATRPADPPDMLGEKGPKILRSILNVLGGGSNGGPRAGPTTVDAHRSPPRASSRVMHDALWDAAMALNNRPDDGTGRRKIIFLVSDGAVRGANTHNLEDTTNLLVRQEIQVYAVATDFATFGSSGALTKYAQATGGDVFPGSSAKSLESSFGRVTEQARNQYILGYFSTNRAGATQVFRSVNVKTRFPKQTVTHRKGYIQVPNPTLPPAP